MRTSQVYFGIINLLLRLYGHHLLLDTTAVMANISSFIYFLSFETVCALPLARGSRQGCPLTHLLSVITLEHLAVARLHKSESDYRGGEKKMTFFLILNGPFVFRMVYSHILINLRPCK